MTNFRMSGRERRKKRIKFFFPALFYMSSVENHIHSNAISDALLYTKFVKSITNEPVRDLLS